ncbi:hypothetical protein HD806DRAFT_532213 [Xylariaceae sp. AK1471]|nr:hypothetical protein HD806DRAFT_532213 [Xylariaceae sp. AK1471]
MLVLPNYLLREWLRDTTGPMPIATTTLGNRRGRGSLVSSPSFPMASLTKAILIINHRTQSLSELTLPCPLDRTNLVAMDSVLKSHDFEVCYDATVVHKADAPELLDGKATDRKFHALGSAPESRAQNKPLLLGRLSAAAMSQQVALKNLWELASRRLPLNSSETLVESIMEPLTVRIDGLGLTQPVTWWAETDNPRDEWIQRFNGNVAEVLVPVIQAWKVGSQRVKLVQANYSISNAHSTNIPSTLINLIRASHSLRINMIPPTNRSTALWAPGSLHRHSAFTQTASSFERLLCSNLQVVVVGSSVTPSSARPSVRLKAQNLAK